MPVTASDGIQEIVSAVVSIRMAASPFRVQVGSYANLRTSARDHQGVRSSPGGGASTSGLRWSPPLWSSTRKVPIER